jgi:hypothetical protein
MKKYLVVYHSSKNIECNIILWWVLVLLFVHLTSKLASTFSCRFIVLSLKNIIGNMFSIDLDAIYNHILDGLLPMKTTHEGWKGA